MAATRALAALAKENVPDSVAALYGLRNVHFGPDYLIPFPFDPRVLLWVAVIGACIGIIANLVTLVRARPAAGPR